MARSIAKGNGKGSENSRVHWWWLVAVMCHVANAADEARDSKAIADQIKVSYERLWNRQAGPCRLDNIKGEVLPVWNPAGFSALEDQNRGAKGPCFSVELSFLGLPHSAETDQWALYFSQPDKYIQYQSNQLALSHVTGSLYKLEPKTMKSALREGSHARIRLLFMGASHNDSKAMPNYYLVMGDEKKAYLLDSTRLFATEKSTTDKKTFVRKNRNSIGRDLSVRHELYERYQPEFRRRFQGEIAQAATYRTIPQVSYAQPLAVEGVDLKKGIRPLLGELAPASVSAALDRLEKFGVVIREQGTPILFTKIEATEPERSARGLHQDATYRVLVENKRINIEYQDEASAYYAVQTIAALLDLGHKHLPSVEIQDWPRYQYRGLHIDIARHFRSKAFLIKLIEQMGAYKLNRLHLHLADDEAWRLEIPALPELTQIGARQCFDMAEKRCLLPQLGALVQADGEKRYLTVDDYQDILVEARRHHIKVIPSFDMPGHARAAIKSMEARYQTLSEGGKLYAAKRHLLSDLQDNSQYESIQFFNDNTINPCLESSYRFTALLFDQLEKIHQNVNVPLEIYHIGADETAGAWQESPACVKLYNQSMAYPMAYPMTYSMDRPRQYKDLFPYFTSRLVKQLSSRGIVPAMWSDGFDKSKHSITSGVYVYHWDVLSTDGLAKLHRQLDNQSPVILSLPDALYFDFPYSNHSQDAGYRWATDYIDTRKVFDLMPDNLAAMAEVYQGIDRSPLTIKDSVEGKSHNIFGLQAQLWGEVIHSDAIAEQHLFPRLLALAERAWHKPAWSLDYVPGLQFSAQTGLITEERISERDFDWAVFSEVLGLRELPKLDQFEVNYHVPMVGAQVGTKNIKLSLPYPGLEPMLVDTKSATSNHVAEYCQHLLDIKKAQKSSADIPEALSRSLLRSLSRSLQAVEVRSPSMGLLAKQELLAFELCP